MPRTYGISGVCNLVNLVYTYVKQLRCLFVCLEMDFVLSELEHGIPEKSISALKEFNKQVTKL